MQMNYHEMTMNEPRNSPARKQQYLVICTVMAAVFFHSVLQAGGLASVNITEGVFPGGHFVFKQSKRDYAAAKSMKEVIAKDAGLRWTNETVDRLYGIFLDDPNIIGGRRQRFACGLLLNDENSKDDTKSGSIQTIQEQLMESNRGKVPPTTDDELDDGAHKLWPKLLYEETELPSTKALVVQFPYTDGFVSAMIFAMKVLPKLRAAATDAGAAAVTIVTTCSPKESMCTHYAPLGAESKAFLLGHEDMTAYLKTLPVESSLDPIAGARKLSRRFSKWFDFLRTDEDPKTGGGSSKEEETKESDEL